jgi:uncharacterized membrane protein YdjX (TVP38/TMEM64 family)
LKRGVIAVLIIACFATGLVIWRLRPDLVAHTASWASTTLRDMGPRGWLAMAAAQVLVAASGILPASLIGVAAGAVFGVPVGFAVAALSTLAGALIAFALSRSVFRPAIARLLSQAPRLARIDRAMGRDGWRLVFLLRMSPLMPFAATSYLLGLSSVSRRNYLLGTCGSLPALAGYVFVGSLTDAGLDALQTGAGPWRWVLLAAAVLATMLLTWRLGAIVKRAGFDAEPDLR